MHVKVFDDRLLAITPLERGARFGRVELAGKVCAI